MFGQMNSCTTIIKMYNSIVFSFTQSCPELCCCRQEVEAHMQRMYGDKRARTAIFAESADQLALEAAAAAEDAQATGVPLPNGAATAVSLSDLNVQRRLLCLRSALCLRLVLQICLSSLRSRSGGDVSASALWYDTRISTAYLRGMSSAQAALNARMGPGGQEATLGRHSAAAAQPAVVQQAPRRMASQTASAANGPAGAATSHVRCHVDITHTVQQAAPHDTCQCGHVLCQLPPV